MDFDLNPFDGDGLNVPVQEAVVGALALAAMAKGGPAAARAVQGLAKTGGKVYGVPLTTLAKTPIQSIRTYGPDNLSYKTQDVDILDQVTAVKDLQRRIPTQLLEEGWVQRKGAVLPGTNLADNLPDEVWTKINPSTGIFEESRKASEFANLYPELVLLQKNAAGSKLPAQAMRDALNFIGGRQLRLTNQKGLPFGGKKRDYTEEDLPALTNQMQDAFVNNTTRAAMQDLADYRKTLGGAFDTQADEAFADSMRFFAGQRPKVVDDIVELATANGITDPNDISLMLTAYSRMSGGTNAAGALSRLKKAIELNKQGLSLPESLQSAAGRFAGKLEENKVVNQGIDALNFGGGGGAKTARLESILNDLYGTGGKDTIVLDTNDIKRALNIQNTASDTIPDYLFKEQAFYNLLNDLAESRMNSGLIKNVLGEYSDGKVSAIQSMLRARGA